MKQMNKFRKLSVVVLCYKSEEEIIPFVNLIEKILLATKMDYEIVLVANYFINREDRTPAIIKKMAIKNKKLKPVIKLKKGMMGWDAISGLNAATGDAIALIDGDGQMPPEDLTRLFNILFSGEFDFVKTFRIKRFDGYQRILMSSFFNRFFRLLFPNTFFRDINSKPKLFTKDALKKMDLKCGGWFLDGEIMLEVKRLDLSFAEIPTTFREIEWRASFINWKAVLEMIYSLFKYRFIYWFRK